ncbi:hypothetical protein [Nocardia sp. BMG111209]|uniref:hypothetical protein n=1 Tax=Nocardia sp. BMG111209 TaxID=1160137 RepID=UPI0012DDBE82|nr:hypothetical protein [Nocardia sp. BMG111209]
MSDSGEDRSAWVRFRGAMQAFPEARLAHARAEGYGRAWQDVLGAPDDAQVRKFARAYAIEVAEFYSSAVDVMPEVPDAWHRWRAQGAIDSPGPDAGSVGPVPGDRQLSKPGTWAYASCLEAIGYARGWCDAAGVGSGDAVAFGERYRGLVAAGGSRPAIHDAWERWCADRAAGICSRASVSDAGEEVGRG